MFSTREGQTARVVAHLSDAFEGMGHQVLAASLATRFAGRPESYDAVIVAASVHENLLSDSLKLGVAAGWHTHFDLLGDLLDGRAVRDFWVRHAEAEALYERQFAAA